MLALQSHLRKMNNVNLKAFSLRYFLSQCNSFLALNVFYVKDFVCEITTHTGGKCGSMFKSLHNLNTHMATDHRYSRKTDSESLDMANNINSRKQLKRLEARKAKQSQVQKERPPSKKQR